MVKCSFCNQVVKAGSGKMFVKTDGTVFYFCSSKCEKNYFLGRSAKRLRWIRKMRK